MKNTYFLLRHGETIYQKRKRKIIYPFPDSPKICLTREAKKEIQKVAQKLKKIGIDLIYSSDYFRTKQTAEIVAKVLHKKIIFDKRLRDINLGIYHGSPKEVFYKEFPLISPSRFFQRPPKGESWAECQKRIYSFWQELEKKHKRKKILIVGHGDPLWLLEGKIKGWGPRDFIKNAKKGFIQPGELRKLKL